MSPIAVPRIREKMPPADASDADGFPPGLRRRARSVVQALLRVPLALKILLANAAIVAVTVAGAVLVVRAYPGIRTLSPLALIGGSASLALLVGTAVNAAIVRVAFRPLRALEATAERVEAGHMEARTSVPAVADRQLRRTAAVFDRMLDHVAAEQEARRRLAVEALRGQDRVRQRLADALHDETAQRLAAHVLRLKQIARAETAAEKDRLAETLRDEAADTLESVRRTARGLRTPELEDLGVLPALRAALRTRWPDPDGRVRIEGDELPAAWPGRHRRTLYRILQEALSNALRHADAGTVRVRVDVDGDRVRGRVVDDGRGFDVPGPGDPAAGLGILAMRELAADVGGRVEIESAPDEGTRVVTSLPLARAGDGAPADGRRDPQIR